MCDPKFVDRQVLMMIRSHAGTHQYGLIEIANKDFKTRAWDRDTIRNAVKRLEKRGVIKSERGAMGGRACKRLYPAKNKGVV